MSGKLIKFNPSTLAIASLLALTGNAAIATPKGELVTPHGQYEFSPRSCSIYIDDGSYDIEISGPGTSLDGEIIFFDFSSVANEISIKLGVDQPFTHSDRQIKAGQHVSEAFEIEVTNNVITAQDIVFRGVSDELMEGAGSLMIDCNS